jgi:hypothetical protein
MTPPTTTTTTTSNVITGPSGITTTNPTQTNVTTATTNPMIAGSFALQQQIKQTPFDKKRLELLEKIRQLESYIEEPEDVAKSQTEKVILLRNLRARKRSAKQELAELITLREETQYENDYEAKRLALKNQRKAAALIACPSGIDERSPVGDEEKLQYHRNENMCSTYKRTIINLKQNIEELLEEDSGGWTQDMKETRELEVASKVNTIKTYAGEYKKCHAELMAIGKADTLTHHLDNLYEVMEISNMLEAKMKLTEEKVKKKLALSKSEQIEGMKLQKFSGTGDKRYLNYYDFYQEFTELVLSKEYSDSTKLKYLKQYTMEDAHDLIKNYHSGQELLTAFKTLDDHYGRSDMVIRESLKNLKHIQPVKSIYDIKANRKVLSFINTNVSTLRCYGFNLEGEGSEEKKSTFLIEMEEKVPHKIYIKWEKEKAS